MWKEAEQARCERNESRRKAYQEELQLWKDERDQAKMERQRPHWGKPKRGKLEPPVPKPVTIGGVAEEEGVKKEDDNDNDQSDDDGCKSAIAIRILIGTDHSIVTISGCLIWQCDTDNSE